MQSHEQVMLSNIQRDLKAIYNLLYNIENRMTMVEERMKQSDLETGK